MSIDVFKKSSTYYNTILQPALVISSIVSSNEAPSFIRTCALSSHALSNDEWH